MSQIRPLSATTLFSTFAIVMASLQGCSSAKLRRFTDDDLKKEVPKEIAQKFEVKDIPANATLLQALVPAPVKVEKKSKKLSRKSKKGAAVSEVAIVPPVRRKAKMPFEVGEKLQYGIRYIGVTAGYFEMSVDSMKAINDREVYYLKGNAKTVKIFELVYRVNDNIESFWDASGLYSHRFTMDLDESKQSRKLIELYDYEKKKSYYWNRVDHSEKGFSEQKEEYDIPLWAQDPLSTLYYVRVLDLPKENGKEIRFPIILDGKGWETRMRKVGQEKIYAGGRDFMADTYMLENYQNGELKNKDNKVWISQDEHRYVLRIEAKLKVGSFAVALDKVL